MESGGDWCLIESDPGVFTQLIKTFGAKGVQVEELWTIDNGIFENLRPVHGLIFLFKYLQHEEPAGPVVTDNRLDKIYFAKQVINNACATQAIISLLLNCAHPDVDIGPELTKLKEFSMSFDPIMRGLSLSNSSTIRTAHNSMSQQVFFEIDPKTASKDDDAYHFVGYMPIDGRLYELDGLRAGPIDHGPIGPGQDWLDVVTPIIRRRINVYTEGEIRFNLMALVSNRKMVYERRLDELLSDTFDGTNSDAVDTDIPNLRMLIEYEDVKMARYEQEMIRRRHNYLPFIIVLLRILAEQNLLVRLYEEAKERAAQKGQKKI
ncbi:ubiquitin carboxyl-terminal hydrolase isozyme L5 [Achroia grisella]|uniref:ubiquitin carboxyl-terminal hydrolase isozyme L5 n=1 Tax=Achroia grisella TaxID=688607 RepID=UPI0027D3287E|nr:ubiquitin carboxyl-terminal hydrolase isozyme L5 [Achroia grisella]XP_059059840.1 ubiquitin carboxyl-terminal hydrolase isozyme L5 [Achroia grisella]